MLSIVKLELKQLTSESENNEENLCPIYKRKSVPLQAWSGPEGSRKLRFPDFMTTAQEGIKVVSLTHRPHLPYIYIYMYIYIYIYIR